MRRIKDLTVIEFIEAARLRGQGKDVRQWCKEHNVNYAELMSC